MSTPDTTLTEPLTLGQETLSRGPSHWWRCVLLLPLLLGAAFVSQVLVTSSAVEEPDIDMFGAKLAQPTIRGMSCPRPRDLGMTVNAMQEELHKHGIPTSPFAKYVLTQIAATRDVSMAAQAKEEFSKLSPVTQAKLKSSARDLVIKAESLKGKSALGKTWERTLDGPLAETELPPNDDANLDKVNMLAGVTNPMGFFDPWGFSTKASKGRLLFYREAELKHGRVCMLASLGIYVGEKYHPLYGGNIDSFNWKGTDWTIDPDWTPVEWDPLQIASKMPKTQLLELQNKELNNGRLAMFAAAGFIAQEYVTGKKIF